MKNKKVLVIVVLIALAALVLYGVKSYKEYKPNNKNEKNEKTEIKPSDNNKNKVNSSQEALNILYSTYILEGSNQSYSFVEETDEGYVFEITGSNDGKIYTVVKLTGEILIGTRLQ